MKKITIAAALSAMALGFSPQVAQADQAFDVTTLGSPACTAAVSGSATMFTYLGCRGSFQGNTNNTGIGAYLNAQFGNTFSYLGSSADAGFGPFGNNPNTVSTGTLTFDGMLSGNFVLAIKASNRMSFYHFAGNNQTSLVFSTIGTTLNNNGGAQDLSHAALWSAEGGGITQVVPEPSTYLLMATGLLGLGIAARRRRNS